MLYVSVEEVLELHRRLIQQTGGAFGVRDHGSLESSVMQHLQSFGDHQFYPTLSDTAAAPNLYQRAAASRVRYYFGRGSKPVSLGPLAVERVVQHA